VLTVAGAGALKAPEARKIEAPGMIGVEVLDRAVLFSARGNLLTQTRFELRNGGAAKCLVCDVQPGDWVVSDGPKRASKTYTATPEGKCLYFEGAPGRYELRRL
jgi:hypothetical protein